MRRLSLVAVVALMATGVAGVGAKDKFLPFVQPGPMPLVAEKTDAAIAQLIKDLGDEDYRTREKASRELVAKGDKALPQMRAALRATESPEVQRRLSVMIRKMDTERLVAPRRVTIAKKEMSVKAALDEISKQSGYKIDYSGGANTEENQTFEFDNVPFWVAIDKVATSAGCVVYAEEYGDESIRVYNQDSINPYVAYAGPFRFLATNIHSNDSVQLSGISRRGGNTYRYSNMNLNFQIQSEPKNPMLGVMQPEIISATDENGGSMLMPRNPNDRSNYYNNGSFRGHNTYGNLNLTRGDKTATKIKTLKAKVGVVLLTGTSPEILVTEPLKVKNKTFVGRTMEIDLGSVTEDKNNKGNYVVEMTARKLGEIDPNRPDYNWSNTAWQRIELTDANGNIYRTYGPNNSNNNGNTVTMTIPYGNQDRRGNQTAKLGPPVKLVINEWLSITHEVTFEFKDLPLP